MVLLIDNYDSFTYNIVQYLLQLGEEVRVFRNDEITLREAEDLDFDHLVVSPGPGGPQDAGVSVEMIRHFAGKKPVLGVCLGHQSIGAAFGMEIVRAARVMHGKRDLVQHDGRSLFAGLPNPLGVIRYHSLAIRRESLSPDFEISATSGDGEIMAIRHKRERIEGVQFHPESIGTENGMRILANFISGVRELPPVKNLLARLVAGQGLLRAEASHLMEQILEGALSPAQVGSLLTALTVKGPSPDELEGFAGVLRTRAIPVRAPAGMVLTDTCGTGGDGSGTFNISTAAAFVACGAGVAVAKHGNRSVTSRSGSADVFEALGIPVSMPPDRAAAALAEVGICFLYAPDYHPAFKGVGPVRRELGFRTVFNMIGPMLNPAGVACQVMGVFAPEMTVPVAEVLGRLGVRHALVVHGSDGLDEFTLTGPSRVTEYKEGWLRTFEFDPQDHGFEYCTPADLKGGDAAENAGIIRRVLEGVGGPHRNIVVINAAAAILAAGIATDFPGALALARASIDSGSALARLESLVRFSAGGGG